jgi:hypothetical protein
MLTLVGISALDLEGSHRLCSLLDTFSPNIILIDSSKKDYVEQLNFAEKLLEPASWDNMVKSFESKYPFANKETLLKFTFNLAYVASGITNHIDKNRGTRMLVCEPPPEPSNLNVNYCSANPGSKIYDSQEISPELKKILSLPCADALSEVAKNYARETYNLTSPAQIEYNIKRAAFAANALREINKDTVYITTLEQLYGNYTPTLFDRLNGINVNRMKLSDIDVMNSISADFKK